MFKIHLHPFLSMNNSFRTDVIDRIRRLNDDPREEERAQVENMRQQLTSHFSVLSSMERRLNILPGPVAHFDDGVQSAEFDDIGQDDAQAATGEPAMAPPTEQPDPNLPITPEARTIQFPSNIGLIPGQHGLENSMMQYREEELTVRIAQASKFLGKNPRSRGREIISIFTHPTPGTKEISQNTISNGYRQAEPPACPSFKIIWKK